VTQPMIPTEARAVGGALTEEIDEPHAAMATTRKGIGITGWLSVTWMAIILLASVFGGLLPLDEPNKEVTTPRLAPFQAGHVLGSDSNGRDMLSRLIAGARTSMEIAVFSVLLGLIIGGLLGLFAGYFRNWFGNVLASIFDILLAIPQLVLALALVSVLKGDPNTTGGFKLPIVLDLILALGLVSIPILARITRASTLTWSKRDFVTAARAQGAGHGRILFREVLPNVLPAMMSIALLGVSIAVVAEGGLAILGVSVEPPQATWGTLINSGRTDLASVPFLTWEPVAAVFLTAVALNFLGDVVIERFGVRESAL
jgi:peptide/nickel transport system permease protein